MEEIVRLEQHVAEFSERQPALHPRLHRFLLHHHVDREVFPDVAQEVDEVLLHQPLRVVEQECSRRPGTKLEEARRLVSHASHVLANLFSGKQGSFRGFSGWITNKACPAPHQYNRPMAVTLEIGEQHQRHQVADLETPDGRVEAAVGRDRPLGEMRRETGGRLLDEPAPLQFL